MSAPMSAPTALLGSTDFIIFGVTTQIDVCDPSTCLLASLHNPHRALLSTCMLTSNHGGDTRFVLTTSASAENDDCWDDVERVLLAKAAFRNRQREQRERADRARIKYHWRVDPKTSTIQIDVTEEYQPEKRKVEPDSPISCMDMILQKHKNKFGTPCPARRSSKSFYEERNSANSETSVMDLEAGIPVAVM